MMAASNQPKRFVAVQFGEGIDAPREHREGRLGGLHIEGWIGKRHVGRVVEAAANQPVARVGLGRDALEGLA